MGRSLSRREFEEVIRRAADLASSDPDGADGGLTEEELFRIAAEVGLAEVHVRRALAEVRSGGAGGGVLDEIFGPSHVRASRIVHGAPQELAGSIDEFLVASQLLQSVRRSPGVLHYRPAVDWASQLARAASLSSRKYYIASARSVEVQFEAVGEGQTLVEILVDPGTRAENAAGALVGGGLAGVVLGGLVGWGVAAVAPVALAVGAGAAVGIGFWGVITYATGVSHRRKVAEVRGEVEGVLDALEAGGPLEPPPPSWRRWVRRYFHGMARDFRWDGQTRGER